MAIFKQLASVTVLTILLSGCFGRVQPIYLVTDHPIPSSAQNLSDTELNRAITSAGHKRKWIMEKTGPGQLQATQKRKNHVAVVDIIYSSTSFTLKYKSSENLLYNAPNIHRTYNHWLRNLEADIVTEIHKAAES